MEQIRAFIAIELPNEIRELLYRIQDKLGASRPSSVRWVEPKGIHLTLKFLGNISPDKVNPIVEAMSRAAQGVSPFRLVTAEVGGFPNLKQPRVIWVGLEGDVGILASLQKRIEDSLAPLGFTAEDRLFTPHLTLGRIRESTPQPERRRVGEMVTSCPGEKLTFHVEALSLMKSTLTPAGAVYNRLASVELERGIDGMLSIEP